MWQKFLSDHLWQFAPKLQRYTTFEHLVQAEKVTWVVCCQAPGAIMLVYQPILHIFPDYPSLPCDLVRFPVIGGGRYWSNADGLKLNLDWRALVRIALNAPIIGHRCWAIKNMQLKICQWSKNVHSRFTQKNYRESILNGPHFWLIIDKVPKIDRSTQSIMSLRWVP